MKKYIAMLIVLVVSGMVAIAQPGMNHHNSAGESLFQKQLQALLEAQKGKGIGSFTVEELQKIAEQLSIAYRQEQHINKSRAISFMHPGMGQYMNRDALGGTLFLIGDLAVVAGTLVGAYFLLPADLQFEQLNYLTEPFSSIKERWLARNLEEALPVLGVLAGGALVKFGLGALSSSHAGGLAKKNVSEGKIKFEPHLFWDGHSGMGMGMRMKF